MPDENPQVQTSETPQAPAEQPSAAPIDDLGDLPDEVRETGRMLRDNYSKLTPKQQAEVLFAAANGVRNSAPAPAAPAPKEPKAKSEDEDDDRPMTLKEWKAAEKARQEREQFQRDTWTRDQQIKSEIARDPLTKDDPELAETVYKAAMGEFLTRGGDVAYHTKREIEKLRKRDSKRDEEYLKRKTDDASKTRGEGGPRSPATKVQEGTLRDWEAGNLADKVLEKRGWK